MFKFNFLSFCMIFIIIYICLYYKRFILTFVVKFKTMRTFFIITFFCKEKHSTNYLNVLHLVN